MQLRVRGGRALHGEAEVPPDKSILHRALILGALGEVPTSISPLGQGADNRSTLSALSTLGVSAEIDGDRAVIMGVGGVRGLRNPEGFVDCGNSGTTIRLLSGVVAAGPHLTVTFDGDASLRRRPMERLRPLEAMGARLSSPDGGRLKPPFTVHGKQLKGGAHQLPVASAQVKSALLLAGLFAEGETTITEPRTSRDHTERMLAARGVELRRSVDDVGAHTVTVAPLQTPWVHREAIIPPDVSSATFLFAAAAVTGGKIRVSTGVNPTRTGALDILGSMGVRLERLEHQEQSGEPVALVEASRPDSLAAYRIFGDESLRAIDELPMLAGLALFADGTTTIADAAELRVKESDRIAEVQRVLSQLGGDVTATDDGLIIHGGHPLRPGEVDAAGDHRIAMTAAVVALGIPGETVIHGAEVIGVSFPGFVETLSRLGAHIQTT